MMMSYNPQTLNIQYFNVGKDLKLTCKLEWPNLHSIPEVSILFYYPFIIFIPKHFFFFLRFPSLNASMMTQQQLCTTCNIGAQVESMRARRHGPVI